MEKNMITLFSFPVKRVDQLSLCNLKEVAKKLSVPMVEPVNKNKLIKSVRRQLNLLYPSVKYSPSTVLIEHDHRIYYYLPFNNAMPFYYSTCHVKIYNNIYHVQCHDWSCDYYHIKNQWYKFVDNQQITEHKRIAFLTHCKNSLDFLTCRTMFYKWYYVIHNTVLVKDILQYMFWLYQTRLSITFDQFQIV